MYLVYIAGAYTAPTPYEVELNIDRAKQIAMHVWKLKAAAVCPHTNSAHFEGCADYKGFSEGTMEMMRRCDAVILVSIVLCYSKLIFRIKTVFGFCYYLYATVEVEGPFALLSLSK